jgi:hypothetical protein
MTASAHAMTHNQQKLNSSQSIVATEWQQTDDNVIKRNPPVISTSSGTLGR